MNYAATVCAIRRYLHSKITGTPLKWVKTEHMYPNRVALLEPELVFAGSLRGGRREKVRGI